MVVPRPGRDPIPRWVASLCGLSSFRVGGIRVERDI